MTRTKFLVLGASGMLGNTVYKYLAGRGLPVSGTMRSSAAQQFFSTEQRPGLQIGVDLENPEDLARALEQHTPNVVINCVGLVKQRADPNDPLAAIPVNSLLPHRIARLCASSGIRLIHVSTDCVFDGRKGNYTEDDFANANDLYGRSKLLGEVDYPNAITLRTSIIGHEICSNHGLLDWFLMQKGSVEGYSRAIFSGVPAVEIARIIVDFVDPKPQLHGLYHVSADPISKLDLLRLVAAEYGKEIDIVPDDKLKIDRSLNSSRFRSATGYEPPSWPSLIAAMHAFRQADAK